MPAIRHLRRYDELISCHARASASAFDAMPHAMSAPMLLTRALLLMIRYALLIRYYDMMPSLGDDADDADAP